MRWIGTFGILDLFRKRGALYLPQLTSWISATSTVSSSRWNLQQTPNVETTSLSGPSTNCVGLPDFQEPRVRGRSTRVGPPAVEAENAALAGLELLGSLGTFVGTSGLHGLYLKSIKCFRLLLQQIMLPSRLDPIPHPIAVIFEFIPRQGFRRIDEDSLE